MLMVKSHRLNIDLESFMRLIGRSAIWLLLSTVFMPAVLTICVGILILVFYREAWDVAFGVLVMCFSVFAIMGSSITLYLMRRIEHLTRLQSEFIANISHDFRTPLTSIKMFVETLQSGRIQDDAEIKRCLDVMARETEHMERLIQRVLAFRQIDQENVDLKITGFDPSILFREALEPYFLDPVCKKRLEMVVEPNLPRILVDRDLILEAMRNLVDNALKYSGVSPVIVTLRNDGKGIAISVRDQGKLIPRREQKRIFKRFYRGTSVKTSGSGLGLSIAKHAAEAHGGRLTLTCTKELGNIFTFTLPHTVSTPTISSSAPFEAEEALENDGSLTSPINEQNSIKHKESFVFGAEQLPEKKNSPILPNGSEKKAHAHG